MYLLVVYTDFSAQMKAIEPFSGNLTFYHVGLEIKLRLSDLMPNTLTCWASQQSWIRYLGPSWTCSFVDWQGCFCIEQQGWVAAGGSMASKLESTCMQMACCRKIRSTLVHSGKLSFPRWALLGYILYKEGTRTGSDVELFAVRAQGCSHTETGLSVSWVLPDERPLHTLDLRLLVDAWP